MSWYSKRGFGSTDNFTDESLSDRQLIFNQAVLDEFNAVPGEDMIIVEILEMIL